MERVMSTFLTSENNQLYHFLKASFSQVPPWIRTQHWTYFVITLVKTITEFNKLEQLCNEKYETSSTTHFEIGFNYHLYTQRNEANETKTGPYYNWSHEVFKLKGKKKNTVYNCTFSNINNSSIQSKIAVGIQFNILFIFTLNNNNSVFLRGA